MNFLLYLRKTQTRCHNDMNLFNNARRVSEYWLHHQLRAAESIGRLLGAVGHGASLQLYEIKIRPRNMCGVRVCRC